MNGPFTFTLKFPGDLEYIPVVRKFVSDALQANEFSPKFAYRSEIIIDEICNNAVSYGCTSVDAAITLTFRVFGDHIEFSIQDEGGNPEHIEKLKSAVRSEERPAPEAHAMHTSGKSSMGLEIVRMLCDDLTVHVGQNNLTSISVVKMREETEPEEAGEVPA